MSYKYATIDIESTGLNRYQEKITYIGVGLSKELGETLDKITLYDFSNPEDIEKFSNLCKKLRKHKVKTIFQNGNFDTLFIEYNWDILLPISHDIMLMGTAFDLVAEHGLKAMAQRYLGVPDWDIDKKTKLGKGDMNKLKEYLGYDVKYTWALFNFFMNEMNSQQKKIYKKLLKPAYLMYRRVEREGIYYDLEKDKEVKKAYKKHEKECLKKLTDQYDINWNSPDQVREVLFEKEGLPTIKLSPKGKPSTDAKVLKRLVSKGYELPQLILDYKFYRGANTKFLNKWADYAQHDGRIHPHFNLTNVITGRTSCSDPNLQQVPRNKELRSLFTAPKGRVLIEADYSQLELRIAADYANEPHMIKIYKEGGDIHTETAMTLNGGKEPSYDDRTKAKPVNFGFLYGMSAKGFTFYAFDNYSQVFTQKEAERYRELFFAKYSGLPEWHKEMEYICELNGGVANRFGRFRALPKIFSNSSYERGEAVRRAINTPVQGTGSDLLISSCAEIDTKLRPDMDLRVVGTVHDSILADVPEDCVEDAVREIKKIMEHPEIMDIFGVSFKVPLIADVSIGPWGKGKELEEWLADRNS